MGAHFSTMAFKNELVMLRQCYKIYFFLDFFFFCPGETLECLILWTCMRIPKIEVFDISGIWKLISTSKLNDGFYNMHKYTLEHSIALN